MKKYWKWILALIAVGTAAGLIIAHFVKKNKEADDLDEFAEDDFDLDADLQPVSEREYVSLKKSVPEAEDEKANDAVEPAEEAEETDNNED